MVGIISDDHSVQKRKNKDTTILNKFNVQSKIISNQHIIHIQNSLTIEYNHFIIKSIHSLYHYTLVYLILITWLYNVKAKSNYNILLHKTIDLNKENFSIINNYKTNWNKNNLNIEPWEPLNKPIENKHEKFFHKQNEWKHEKIILNNLRLQYQLHRLYLLNNHGAKCNDGSFAGYYYRPAKYPSVGNWIIFLEGGWYCFDEETCVLRESNAFSLFSSKFWPKTRSLGGILSSDSNANPNYHEFHSVFIPYCSSDLWTGKMANRSGDFYFHGSRILAAVIDDLPWHNAAYAEKVIFAGSSAGGIGVLMNVDRLAHRLFNRIGHPVLVSGIIDSSWFIHIPAYQESKCINAFECPPEEGIHRGMKLWNPRIPKSCRKAYPKEQKWKCYLAPFMYPHLRTPVYIVQSLFDEAQMQMSKVPLLTGGTYSKWSYIQNLGKEVARSLQSAGGVFAPSCLDHEILTKNNWVHKMIGTISLVNAIKSWDNELEKQWIKQKILYFSTHFPNALIKTEERVVNNLSEVNKSKEGATTEKLTTTTTNTATNSTLMFLSRLVNLLNQHPRRLKRSSMITFADVTKASNLNDITMLKSYPYALIMTRLSQSKLSKTIKQQKKPRNYINSIFRRHSGSSMYHVIDSCGLFSVDGIQGGYLCKNMPNEAVNNNQNKSSIRINNFVNKSLKYTPAIDHLIPQCNPTCGYISNPQRMKLVDVLALYEVNTDLLASLLGLSASKLRSYDSEQQMRALFCGNNRVRRGLSRLILPQLSV
ncbi:Palmitoleoyl-protein carboxylesterase NOTUM [Schistosoma japonicum]|nr:Palmitoleoyl-protein carboxylesterase NOTUM [Schistosoma japonicum]